MFPDWLAHLGESMQRHASLSGARPEDYVLPELRDRGRLPAEETSDYDYITMGEDGLVIAGTFERGVVYTANVR